MDTYFVNKVYSKEKDKEIIAQVIKELNINCESEKYFNEGAYSRVILINDRYLIKQSNKDALKAEVEFLKLQISPKLQKIILVDDDYDFVVYEFIIGNVMKRNLKNVKELVEEIVKFTLLYKNYLGEGFGHLYKEVETWDEFLISEMNYYSLNLLEYSKDKQIVEEAINELKKYPFDKKLLHGDLGTHNFIEEGGKLNGIIDPMPIIGDYLYDLLSAVLSNIEIIEKFEVKEIFEIVDEPKKKIEAMLIVVTYFRLSKCLKYHKQDFEKYLKFWVSLKEL